MKMKYSGIRMQGNADAQYNLGRCYQHGRGVAQDLDTALELYRLSANQCNQ
jgi:TPR repeat protein